MSSFLKNSRGFRILTKINYSNRRNFTITPEQKKAVDNCISLVKQHDFDNYLIGILLPVKLRGPFFAVRAYHVELALIKEQSRKNVLTGTLQHIMKLVYY
jgi:hypothetical protein